MRRVLLFLFVTFMAWRSSAEHHAHRVELISEDGELARALPAALAPLGVAVITVPSAPDLELFSSRQADEGVAATIWISADGNARFLNVRERRTLRVFQRAIPHTPPFAPADAASIALMARTMLLALEGFAEAPESAVAQQADVAAREHVAPPLPPSHAPHGLRLEVGGGTRVASSGDVALAALGAMGWYRAPIGVGLSVAVSSATDVASSSFRGQLHDDFAAITVRLPIAIGARVLLEPEAGMSLHWVRLSGSLPRDVERSVNEHAVDPGLIAGGRLGLAITPKLYGGLWVQVGTLLRRQRYLYESEVITRVPRVNILIGPTLGVNLH